MTSGISIEEHLEQMRRRLERDEQGNRALKIVESIAFAALIAVGSGPFASTVMAKKMSVPKRVVAQEFELDTADGTPLAALVSYEGGSTLVFYSGATPEPP